MSFSSWEISIAAIIPAIILMIIVFVKDKIEKEPISLLIGLFFSGAVVYVPVYFIENYLLGLMDKLFAEQLIFTGDGMFVFTSKAAEYGYSALSSFICTAFIEILFKGLVLFLITRKSKNFNYLFDGVVYSVFVALGFSVVGSVNYALVNGWEMLFMHSVSSVPIHFLLGIVMGCIYTLWHTCYTADVYEQKLSEKGAIVVKKPIISSVWLVTSVIIPTIIYGTFVMFDKYIMTPTSLVFYIVLAVVYVSCFALINHLSDKDKENRNSAYIYLRKKYPELKIEQLNEIENK